MKGVDKLKMGKWTQPELTILRNNVLHNIDELDALLPYRTKRSIAEKLKAIKTEIRMEEEMHKPRPTPHKLTMQEGKPYRLSRMVAGNDGRCSSKSIKVKLIKIFPNFILCEHKVGYKECFQRVDLGRIIHYKEVV